MAEAELKAVMIREIGYAMQHEMSAETIAGRLLNCFRENGCAVIYTGKPIPHTS